MNVIYLIHAEDTKRYKIGTTSHSIEKRLNELQTGCPFKLRPVLSVVGDKYQETKIHDEFKKYRKQGEWFEFDSRIKRKVMKYMDEFGDECCQEKIIQLKEYKEWITEEFCGAEPNYRRGLSGLLELVLINMELGCFEEAIHGLEEYYFHVNGDHSVFYGTIKPNNFIYKFQ